MLQHSNLSTQHSKHYITHVSVVVVGFDSMNIWSYKNERTNFHPIIHWTKPNQTKPMKRRENETNETNVCFVEVQFFWFWLYFSFYFCSFLFAQFSSCSFWMRLRWKNIAKDSKVYNPFVKDKIYFQCFFEKMLLLLLLLLLLILF